jgi:HSP20 family protein
MRLSRMNSPGGWSGFDDQLSVLRDEINRMFEGPGNGFGRTSGFFGGWTPAIDLYEDKDHLIVKAELPGMKKEEIELSLHQGSLTISGERKFEHGDTKASRSERFFGRFQRSIGLPKEVDAGKVNATYKDGILTVSLAKTEASKPRQIEVKAS